MNLRRFILTAILAIASSHASAGFISIQSETSVSLENGKVLPVITLTNLGDQPAYDLSVTAICSGNEGFSKREPDLTPDESATFAMDLGTAPEPAGLFTVIFKIFYTDSGGTQFSALNSITLVTDLDSPPRHILKITADNVQLNKKGSIQADIASSVDANNVRLSLFLPDEISCRQNTQTLAVTGGSATASFDIKNKGCNPGSTYLALLVADYVQDGMHMSKASPLNIKVSSTVTASQSPALFILLTALALGAILLQIERVRSSLHISGRRLAQIETAIVLIAIAAVEIFLIWHLQPKYLFMDTTTVGGDTPAHNYIASHLRDSLFGHGKIVSWAGGWWCGFPMFQFYFSLPYLCMVALDIILPFNIAFKLIAVAGILLLPPAMLGAGKLLRLPKPVPEVLGLSALLMLFDHSHTMWGVNIYSTLAGMISNSLSFPLMLLAVASSWRDAEDKQFRIVTVLLLVAVLASHFFTSIVGIITIGIIPFLRKRSDIPHVIGILAAEVALALLLVSWWIVPLLLKLQYTADFGINWDILFWKQLPTFTKVLAPLLVPALFMLFARKTRALLVFVWMLFVSLILFFFGFGISNVFVNVRLWPFIIFSIMLLEAVGLGYLLSLLPSGRAFMLPLALILLMFGTDTQNHVRAWAKWNFEGLESKGSYSVFEKLVLPLEGTAGRLANDLADENNMLGSSRIFELAPHLAKKPILEGGIVNSAAGSMFSYYIQGETSRNSAGFPTNVKPTSFNITNATKHLELFNVKHFIARWDTTKNAMHEHKDWRFVEREQQWELFELMSHDGSQIFVPPYMPIAVQTRKGVMDWKTAGMEWIYNIASFSNHFVIVPEQDSLPKDMQFISASDYLVLMRAKDPVLISELQPKKLPTSDISIVEHSDYAIEFSTSQPGIPHIIKSTWYPNWKSTGGERIYMVTPCFMMIIPSSSKVRIVYGRTGSDIAGIILTLIGLTFLLALSARSLLNRRGTS